MTDILIETMEGLGVCLYKSSVDEDILVAQWWDSILNSGELEVLVSSSVRTLSAFYTLFKPPSMMAYTLRDGAIESANWATPSGTSEHAVFFSSWCLPKMRGTKRHALIMSSIYKLLFAMGKKTIIGITKQPALLNLHKGMGYVIVGAVPCLFDESDAWIMYLAEPAFKASRLYAAAKKVLNKENADANRHRTTNNSAAVLGVSGELAQVS